VWRGRGREGREGRGGKGKGEEEQGERGGEVNSDAQLEQGRRLAKAGPACENHEVCQPLAFFPVSVTFRQIIDARCTSLTQVVNNVQRQF